jgi:putative membrane protein
MAYRGRTQTELYERSEMYSSQGGDRRREVWKGLVSGLASGLTASWIMTEYQVNAPKLFAKIQSRGGQPREGEFQQQSAQPSESENPTIRIADTIARKVAKRELPQDRRQTAGNLVHYGYGTLMGGLYGVLGDLWSPVRSARGLAYGAALWAAGDELAVPALGLAKWAPEYPLQVHANALGAHLVYAFSLDSIYSGVHRLLDLASKKATSRETSREREERVRISEFRPVRERSAFRAPVTRAKETFGKESRQKIA